MKKTYYENFLQEIREEILKFIPNSEQFLFILNTTMKHIDGICKNYGVDWKLEGEKKNTKGVGYDHKN